MSLSIQAELRDVVGAEALSQAHCALRLKLGREDIAGADLLGADTSKAFRAPMGNDMPRPIQARLEPPTEPGDQTVPIRSADHQLKSGAFKGVFRQSGYEHQGSCKDPRALASTLYSIVRIAQHAKWKDDA